jgi:membrane fusion protein (multidrug efflux system)
MGTLLITLSDNNVMRGDFEVAKDLYLGYLADANERKDLEVKLRLDDGSIFKHAGEIGTVETDYDNETGTVPVRADFPNPEHLLRGGETGTVLIHRVLNDALVIPQRATFEMVGKRYVFVVDENDVAHRREIVIRSQLKDLLVIKTGLAADDRIILEGIRQVRDGDKVNYAFRPANQADAHLKE